MAGLPLACFCAFAVDTVEETPLLLVGCLYCWVNVTLSAFMLLFRCRGSGSADVCHATRFDLEETCWF